MMLRMSSVRARQKARIGGTFLTALACVAMAHSFLDAGNGIAFSGGAAFALILCVIALLCCAVLPRSKTAWLGVTLGSTLAGCLLGAAISAYFLETPAVLACVIAAMICWLLVMLGRNQTWSVAADQE